jgi:prepilin-type N-terminal cleavage/methylation domain-containing protein
MYLAQLLREYNNNNDNTLQNGAFAPFLFMHKSGFTLIELIIVIAILAILAGMAIIPYTYYLRRAQAKELVNIARACIQEAISECHVRGQTPNLNELESCSLKSNTTKYISNFQINGTPNCNSTFSITATGNVAAGSKFKVTCTYDDNNKDIYCTSPISQ